MTEPAAPLRVAMPIGIVIERRRIEHRWTKERFTPVAVLPGAPPVEDWREIGSGDGFTRYHAATLPLELHRAETEAYKISLAGKPPVVHVCLRRKEADDGPNAPPVIAYRVTASPYEAQDYLDAGDDIVGGVAMPTGLIAWISAFVETHHVEEPFVKRQRKAYRPDPFGYGRAPVDRARNKARLVSNDD
ncbi:MAG: DUF3305 domain-containing protein [Geminicoccaceae bacterium]